jgi:hypothetical protein
MLKDILKKINLFMIDVLKHNGKEDVVVRLLVTLTKVQHGNPLIQDKITYYLKTYEKDLCIVSLDSFAKDIAKYSPYHPGSDIVGSNILRKTMIENRRSCKGSWTRPSRTNGVSATPSNSPFSVKFLPRTKRRATRIFTTS